MFPCKSLTGRGFAGPNPGASLIAGHLQGAVAFFGRRTATPRSSTSTQPFPPSLMPTIYRPSFRQLDFNRSANDLVGARVHARPPRTWISHSQSPRIGAGSRYAAALERRSRNRAGLRQTAAVGGTRTNRGRVIVSAVEDRCGDKSP